MSRAAADVQRLVLDYLRRYWAEYAIVGVVLVPVCMAGAAGGRVAPALTMMLAGVLGPMLTLSRLAPREVRQLPVSQRQLWTVQWLVSVPLTTALVGLPMVAGVVWWRVLSGSNEPGPDAIALWLAWIFLYTGCLVGVGPLMGVVSRLPTFGHPRVRQHVVTILHGVLTVVYVGGLFWPFAIREYLPVSFDEMTLVGAAGAAVALAATILTAAALPTQQLGFEPRRFVGPEPPRWVKWVTVRDPFTGTALFIWRAWYETAWRLGAMVVVFVGTMHVLGGPVDDWSIFAYRGPGTALWPGLALVILSSREGTSLHSAELVRATLRFLRTVPISTGTVASLMVLRRALGWSNLWAALVVMETILLGPMATWQLHLLTLVIGVDAVGDAARLRWSKGRQIYAAGFVVLPVALTLFGRGVLFDDPAANVMAAWGLGLAGVLIAWVLHRGAITRSTSLYRVEPPAPSPFGVQMSQ